MPSPRSRDPRELNTVRSAQGTTLEVPIVYVGRLPEIEQNVRGVIYRFSLGVPRHVPVTVANVLVGRGSFKHASEAAAKIYADPKKWVRKILVARTLHSIGDMIMASVTPKALKRKYPFAEVHVAVPRKSFPLWWHNPWVDELVAWDEVGRSNGNQYDLFFDITRPCVEYETSHHPSRKQRIDIYMEKCGATLPPDEKQPFYLVTDDERAAAREEAGGRFFLGVQLRANAPIRNWVSGANCPQDRNLEIVKRWLALENGIDVVLFDEHEELLKKFPETPRIVKRPGRNLRQTFAMLERCVTMLTLDSGLLHGCGALGVPVVALFGNIHPEARTTYYKDATALFKPKGCLKGIAPCNGDCGRQWCLEAITVDEVWKALTEKWAGAGQKRLAWARETLGHDVSRETTAQTGGKEKTE